MLASVADLVMQPPMYGRFDPSFVRALRPVAREPASVVDTLVPPCTYVVRWSRLLFDGFSHVPCPSYARVVRMQRTGPHRLYEPLVR